MKRYFSVTVRHYLTEEHPYKPFTYVRKGFTPEWEKTQEASSMDEVNVWLRSLGYPGTPLSGVSMDRNDEEKDPWWEIITVFEDRDEKEKG